MSTHPRYSFIGVLTLLIWGVVATVRPSFADPSPSVTDQATSDECASGDSRPCTTSCGSTGVQTCTSTWGSCVPPKESCSNGQDDDCDGKADCLDKKCVIEHSCHGGSCVGFGKVDQSQVNDPKKCLGGGAVQILFATPSGQEFTPSRSTLLAVEILLESFNPPYTDDLTVRIREGSLEGAILGESTETIYHPPAFDKTDVFWHRFVFPTPIFVFPGETYVYEVVATNVSFAEHHVETATVNGDGTFTYDRCDYPGGVNIGFGFRIPARDSNFVTCGE